MPHVVNRTVENDEPIFKYVPNNKLFLKLPYDTIGDPEYLYLCNNKIIVNFLLRQTFEDESEYLVFDEPEEVDKYGFNIYRRNLYNQYLKFLMGLYDAPGQPRIGITSQQLLEHFFIFFISLYYGYKLESQDWFANAFHMMANKILNGYYIQEYPSDTGNHNYPNKRPAEALIRAVFSSFIIAKKGRITELADAHLEGEREFIFLLGKYRLRVETDPRTKDGKEPFYNDLSRFLKKIAYFGYETVSFKKLMNGIFDIEEEAIRDEFYLSSIKSKKVDIDSFIDQCQIITSKFDKEELSQSDYYENFLQEEIDDIFTKSEFGEKYEKLITELDSAKGQYYSFVNITKSIIKNYKIFCKKYIIQKKKNYLSQDRLTEREKINVIRKVKEKIINDIFSRTSPNQEEFVKYISETINNVNIEKEKDEKEHEQGLISDFEYDLRINEFRVEILQDLVDNLIQVDGDVEGNLPLYLFNSTFKEAIAKLAVKKLDIVDPDTKEELYSVIPGTPKEILWVINRDPIYVKSEQISRYETRRRYFAFDVAEVRPDPQTREYIEFDLANVATSDVSNKDIYDKKLKDTLNIILDLRNKGISEKGLLEAASTLFKLQSKLGGDKEFTEQEKQAIDIYYLNYVENPIVSTDKKENFEKRFEETNNFVQNTLEESENDEGSISSYSEKHPEFVGKSLAQKTYLDSLLTIFYYFNLLDEENNKKKFFLRNLQNIRKFSLHYQRLIGDLSRYNKNSEDYQNIVKELKEYDDIIQKEIYSSESSKDKLIDKIILTLEHNRKENRSASNRASFVKGMLLFVGTVLKIDDDKLREYISTKLSMSDYSAFNKSLEDVNNINDIIATERVREDYNSYKHLQTSDENEIDSFVSNSGLNSSGQEGLKQVEKYVKTVENNDDEGFEPSWKPQTPEGFTSEPEENERSIEDVVEIPDSPEEQQEDISEVPEAISQQDSEHLERSIEIPGVDKQQEPEEKLPEVPKPIIQQEPEEKLPEVPKPIIQQEPEVQNKNVVDEKPNIQTKDEDIIDISEDEEREDIINIFDRFLRGRKKEYLRFFKYLNNSNDKNKILQIYNEYNEEEKNKILEIIKNIDEEFEETEDKEKIIVLKSLFGVSKIITLEDKIINSIKNIINSPTYQNLQELFSYKFLVDNKNFKEIYKKLSIDDNLFVEKILESYDDYHSQELVELLGTKDSEEVPEEEDLEKFLEKYSGKEEELEKYIEKDSEEETKEEDKLEIKDANIISLFKLLINNYENNEKIKKYFNLEINKKRDEKINEKQSKEIKYSLSSIEEKTYKDIPEKTELIKKAKKGCKYLEDQINFLKTKIFINYEDEKDYIDQQINGDYFKNENLLKQFFERTLFDKVSINKEYLTIPYYRHKDKEPEFEFDFETVYNFFFKTREKLQRREKKPDDLKQSKEEKELSFVRKCFQDFQLDYLFYLKNIYIVNFFITIFSQTKNKEQFIALVDNLKESSIKNLFNYFFEQSTYYLQIDDKKREMIFKINPEGWKFILNLYDETSILIKNIENLEKLKKQIKIKEKEEENKIQKEKEESLFSTKINNFLEKIKEEYKSSSYVLGDDLERELIEKKIKAKIDKFLFSISAEDPENIEKYENYLKEKEKEIRKEEKTINWLANWYKYIEQNPDKEKEKKTKEEEEREQKKRKIERELKKAKYEKERQERLAQYDPEFLKQLENQKSLKLSDLNTEVEPEEDDIIEVED